MIVNGATVISILDSFKLQYEELDPPAWVKTSINRIKRNKIKNKKNKIKQKIDKKIERKKKK